MKLPSVLFPVLALTLALSLTACGGGGADADPSDTASAADLVKRASYPGAMTVEVTSTSARMLVAGNGRPQQLLRETDWVPVGSISKSFTATLAGVLVQEGRLTWESKLFDVLPEMRGVARADYAAVTLRDLLAHRAGIFPAVTPDQIALLPPTTGTLENQRLQLTRWALQRAAAATPTQVLLYSNGGYLIAAAMLERAGSASFESLLQSRVLKPLGIDARFGAAGSSADEVQGHVATASGGWAALSASSPDAQFPEVANPAGGLKMTAGGIARYLQMHLRALRGGTGEPISPDTARSLHAKVQGEQGLGWVAGSDLQNRALSFHAGSDDNSYYALAAVSRSVDQAVFVFTNGYRSSTESDVSQVAVRLLR